MRPPKHFSRSPNFAVALVSIAAKEAIYRYSKKVGEDLNSPLLIANAWHSRSDAITTLVVLVGAGFSYFGFFFMLHGSRVSLTARLIGKVDKSSCAS